MQSFNKIFAPCLVGACCAGREGQGRLDRLCSKLTGQGRLRCWVLCRGIYRLQYVINTAHQTGAVADQHIAAGGARIHRMAGYSEDFAPLLERLPCGDKRARFRRRFDNYNGLAEA